MDTSQIKFVGRGIEKFLAEFSDCFGRCDTESYLGVYVRGQNSNLQRKSVEPMALQAGSPPRSLQAFLSLLSWDEERVVDRVQQMVMRDHGHAKAIESVDETGSQCLLSVATSDQTAFRIQGNAAQQGNAGRTRT